MVIEKIRARDKGSIRVKYPCVFSKYSLLSTLLFFSLSKDTPKMKSNWVKHKTQRKNTKKPDLGI